LDLEGGRIAVDCFRCKGCGEADASGFACPSCGGKGYFVHKKPTRDYEAEGARAYGAGKPLAANPYRYGWPMHGWVLGWINARDLARTPPQDSGSSK
jgi:hypothetical protein